MSFLFDSLCKMLVEKGLLEKVEFDYSMEVADAKAKEKFDQDLAKAKEDAKSEILAELEKFYVNQWGQNTIEIGKRLIAAKKIVAQGEWQNLLENNFNMTELSARNFIKW